jgi:DNA-binding NtrC family response regulator
MTQILLYMPVKALNWRLIMTRLEIVERYHIALALREAAGNYARTCRALKIRNDIMTRRRRKYDIPPFYKENEFRVWFTEAEEAYLTQ